MEYPGTESSTWGVREQTLAWLWGVPIFSAKAKSNVWLNSCLTVRNIASRICQTARSYTRVTGLVPSAAYECVHGFFFA